MAFREEIQDLWNSFKDIDFQANQTRILGPLGCFIWCCNILGWTPQTNFEVSVTPGHRLHLIFSPLETWQNMAEQAWFDFALSKCRIPEAFRSFHVPAKTWHCATNKDWLNKHPLALRYRTFGILSGSAVAQMNNTEEKKCEFCTSTDTGHIHLVTSCAATEAIRNSPEYSELKKTNIFTRCTGIPAQVKVVPTDSDTSLGATPVSDPNKVYYVFTDGSASPADLPQVRLSSWAMVWTDTHLGSFPSSWEGITPGPFHTIARAETYAVVQALKTHPRLVLHIDNQGVVSNLKRISREGYNPLGWRAVPNNDLWLTISQLVVSRPKSWIAAVKVKSHLKISDQMSPTEQWLTRGNDCADEKAKEVLHLYSATKIHLDPHWRPTMERQKVAEARLATQYLHHISLHLLTLRKNSSCDPQDDTLEVPLDVPQEDFSLYQPMVIHFPSSFPENKWDPRWLHLVGAYFAQLKWPPEDAAPSEVSCIELMLDLMIHYQVTMPVNTPFLRRVGGSSSISWDKHSSQYYLPSRKEALALPEPLLTELSHTWLFTLEYLGTRVKLTPIPRSNSRSLRHFAYNNSVPSFAMRPVLLAGQRVNTLLAATIRPRSRALKFRVSIPRMIPGDLPPCFSPDF